MLLLFQELQLILLIHKVCELEVLLSLKQKVELNLIAAVLYDKVF